MKGPVYLTLIIFALLLAHSCVPDEREENRKREEKLISDYLSNHGISTDTRTKGGIYFVEEIAGTGKTPQKNDYIIISYTGRYLEDSVIHETTDSTLRNEWPASERFTNYLYGPVKFQYGHSLAGINEGLSLMKEGGRATLIIPSDNAFLDGVPFVYDVELHKVISEPIHYEDSILTKFRNDNGFDDATAYKDIWLKETVTPDPDNEVTVTAKDTVFFMFTGQLVDSYGDVITHTRIFDTNLDDNVPVKLLYNTTSKVLSGSMLSLPKGLLTALDSMRVGTHATVLLPYNQAFDSKGLYSPVYGYWIIPPYQTVEYNIIVLDIQSPAK